MLAPKPRLTRRNRSRSWPKTVNAGAPAAFAEALAALDGVATRGRLQQVSTDFVFNGAQGTPYRPEQSVDPLGAISAARSCVCTASGGGADDHHLRLPHPRLAAQFFAAGLHQHEARLGAGARADSKSQQVADFGCRRTIESNAVMSCITACMPARIDRNPARRSRLRAAVRSVAIAPAPLPR